MDDKNQLIYFIKTQKENLGFENNKELLYKIKNSFDFRFKLQKYVFISKYFGWNHHYNYKLYIKGPYSTALAEDYYSKDFIKYTPIKINEFNLNSFNKFISKKTNHFLEATSTILYEDLSSLNSTITKLNKIKPYISSEIVEKSFKNIIEFNLEKSIIANYNYHENLIHMKKKLIEKMKYYIDYFEYFGQCNNGIIISGSVDYLRIVLREENLNDELKSDLLEIIRKYLENIENIYYICDGNGELFSNLNLNYLIDLFNRLQDYISEDLCILPRVDDEDFNETLCYRW